MSLSLRSRHPFTRLLLLHQSPLHSPVLCVCCEAAGTCVLTVHCTKSHSLFSPLFFFDSFLPVFWHNSTKTLPSLPSPALCSITVSSACSRGFLCRCSIFLILIQPFAAPMSDSFLLLLFCCCSRSFVFFIARPNPLCCLILLSFGISRSFSLLPWKG